MANPEHQQRLRTALQAKKAEIDLSGCDLSGVRYDSIPLNGANLRGANLHKADLTGGYFRGCDLSNANCSRTKISTSDFRDANLAGADLTGADWTGAVLNGANLSGANLSRAKLVKARLEGANLTGANLKGADLRGVQGLTAEQFHAAKNGNQAILDEQTLLNFGQSGDREIARHGKPAKKRTPPQVDLLFTDAKPAFGDVFLLCGFENPAFPPTGDYGFSALADLGIEQVDDFFGLCVDGDPVVWILPLVNGNVVAHHPGPYDGLRVAAGDGRRKSLWLKCLTRFENGLRLPITRAS
jgi:hypothetical protein